MSSGFIAEPALQALASGDDHVGPLRASACPHPARGGWRMSLGFERRDPRQPAQLRPQLRLAGNLLSETWIHALAPE